MKIFNLTPHEPHEMHIVFSGSNKFVRNFRTLYPVLVQHYLVVYGTKPLPWVCEAANITEGLLNAVLFDGAELLLDEFMAIVHELNAGRYNPLPPEYFASSVPADMDPTSTRYRAKREKLKRQRAELAKQFVIYHIPFDNYTKRLFRSINTVLQDMNRDEAISNAEYWLAFENLRKARAHFCSILKARYEPKRTPRNLCAS